MAVCSSARTTTTSTTTTSTTTTTTTPPPPAAPDSLHPPPCDPVCIQGEEAPAGYVLRCAVGPRAAPRPVPPSPPHPRAKKQFIRLRHTRFVMIY
ncbi:hypothetical protein E2C01_033082 [Portunus trituberculatus]|uniref:Uncharacterized protein n=1 Tax=Portunus trituberculatus TaxID=210409 RepID=A0A5B7F385_PORTR|nr:hypothetical protein [Portunus trituberculatus]